MVSELKMIAEVEAKTCAACGKSLTGRGDKKFCDNKCRSIYHNQLRAISNYSNYVKNINNALLKNRGILDSIFTGESIKVSFETLQVMGFNFKYHTHTHIAKTGKVYYYSYDYGYLPLENRVYLIVRHIDEYA